ncbi:PepSY domain-containing protein [Piscibacillus salipiscarius]|uniref:PepSY domain-containing protein n=1 Tax=Piscibacillus salipiscarius TaxID=299480 RepID=A0ABW5QCY1_9BACI|nr:PepSY domain-containing protein [Piscibacillus salipiscarius]
MKRKMIAGALASTIAVGGTVGAVTYSDSISKTSNQKLDVKGKMESQATVNANKLIGVEELEDIVLNKVDGSIEDVELDTRSDNKAYYEVEVLKDEQEYELIIDGYTGKVLKVEGVNHTSKSNGEEQVEVKDDENKSQKNTEPIGKEKAIRLALEVTSGKVSDIELEEDDGQYVYEVEVKGEKESGVKIDAYTGAIIDIELDD